MPRVNFSRTFHPVGQGAFYSELFSFDENQKFLTIYDCGTDLRNPKLGTPSQILHKLENRINQDLGSLNQTSDKHNVQLLFLSHFDEDHVCGVQFLNPRVVVIPLLTQDEIIYYEILDYLQVSHINWHLLLNPKLYFGNGTIVIGVTPEREDNDNLENLSEIEINEEGGISGGLNSQQTTIPNHQNIDGVIGGGSIINLKNIWKYIVFNPLISKLQDFKNALIKAGWNWDTLSDDLKSNLTQDKIKELHDIYKQVRNDLNSTSLLVYSGPVETLHYIEFVGQKVGSVSWSCRYDDCYCNRCYDCYKPKIDYRSACMYFGDWKISTQKLQKYYSKLLNHGDNIGYIQIPHHGSIYNKGNCAVECLNDPYYIKSVISCGVNNRFDHPSNKIILKLMELGGEIILVTENTTSAFIVRYQLYY